MKKASKLLVMIATLVMVLGVAITASAATSLVSVKKLSSVKVASTMYTNGSEEGVYTLTSTYKVTIKKSVYENNEYILPTMYAASDNRGVATVSKNASETSSAKYDKTKKTYTVTVTDVFTVKAVGDGKVKLSITNASANKKLVTKSITVKTYASVIYPYYYDFAVGGSEYVFGEVDEAATNQGVTYKLVKVYDNNPDDNNPKGKPITKKLGDYFTVSSKGLVTAQKKAKAGYSADIKIASADGAQSEIVNVKLLPASAIKSIAYTGLTKDEKKNGISMGTNANADNNIRVIPLDIKYNEGSDGDRDYCATISGDTGVIGFSIDYEENKIYVYAGNNGTATLTVRSNINNKIAASVKVKVTTAVSMFDIDYDTTVEVGTSTKIVPTFNANVSNKGITYKITGVTAKGEAVKSSDIKKYATLSKTGELKVIKQCDLVSFDVIPNGNKALHKIGAVDVTRTVKTLNIADAGSVKLGAETASSLLSYNKSKKSYSATLYTAAGSAEIDELNIKVTGSYTDDTDLEAGDISVDVNNAAVDYSVSGDVVSIFPVESGKAVVTIAAGPKKIPVSITVKKDASDITSAVADSDNTIVLSKDATFKKASEVAAVIKAQANSSDVSLVYTAENGTAISNKKPISVKAGGSVNVKVTTKGNARTAQVTKVYTIKVPEKAGLPVESDYLIENYVTSYANRVGGSTDLTNFYAIDVKPSYEGTIPVPTVKYSLPKNDKVAKVDANGKLTLIGVGTTTVNIHIEAAAYDAAADKAITVKKDYPVTIKSYASQESIEASVDKATASIVARESYEIVAGAKVTYDAKAGALNVDVKDTNFEIAKVTGLFVTDIVKEIASVDKNLELKAVTIADTEIPEEGTRGVSVMLDDGYTVVNSDESVLEHVSTLEEARTAIRLALTYQFGNTWLDVLGDSLNVIFVYEDEFGMLEATRKVNITASDAILAQLCDEMFWDNVNATEDSLTEEQKNAIGLLGSWSIQSYSDNTQTFTVDVDKSAAEIDAVIRTQVVDGFANLLAANYSNVNNTAPYVSSVKGTLKAGDITVYANVNADGTASVTGTSDTDHSYTGVRDNGTVNKSKINDIIDDYIGRIASKKYSDMAGSIGHIEVTFKVAGKEITRTYDFNLKTDIPEEPAPDEPTTEPIVDVSASDEVEVQ